MSTRAEVRRLLLTVTFSCSVLPFFIVDGWATAPVVHWDATCVAVAVGGTLVRVGVLVAVRVAVTVGVLVLVAEAIGVGVAVRVAVVVAIGVLVLTGVTVAGTVAVAGGSEPPLRDIAP